MRERLITRLAPQLADFMADCFGRVERCGSQWAATDGGASFTCSELTPEEAEALDYAARKFAYPDA